MLTPQDVRSVQFEKNLRGYRTEDVDHFLDKVEQQLGQDAEQMEALRKQVADLTAENETLRRNMQSYEADGDMLKYTTRSANLMLRALGLSLYRVVPACSNSFWKFSKFPHFLFIASANFPCGLFSPFGENVKK